mmetsp:Transcript_114660/g.365682  ORF Transcript_114660/g.365682 Transcript_114660/m.365682 type:complete len:211 (-) Transcript_114660:179-811(-)
MDVLSFLLSSCVCANRSRLCCSASFALVRSWPAASSFRANARRSCSAAWMASSRLWLCAAASSACCCACTSRALRSRSSILCRSSVARFLASASSAVDFLLAPFDDSTLVRAELKLCSSSFLLASDSSSFCCSFRTERSDFSAAFACGASSSASAVRRCMSSSREAHCFFSASRAASRRAASKLSCDMPFPVFSRVFATSICTERSRRVA